MPQVLNVRQNICARCGVQMPPASLTCPSCGYQHPSPYAVQPAAFAPRVSSSYRPANALSIIVVVLLALNLLNALWTLGLEWRGYGMMGQLAQGLQVDDQIRSSLGGQLELGGTLDVALVLITAIPFLMWVYRTHKNLDGLRVGALEYSHGWAVGWFFVPIMNLFRPKQVMDEIWEGSEAAGSSMLTGVWWVCWILCGMLGRAASAAGTANSDPSTFATMFQMLMVDNLLAIVAGAALVAIVLAIQKGQDAKAARLSRPAFP